jgi:hypothetical protein
MRIGHVETPVGEQSVQLPVSDTSSQVSSVAILVCEPTVIRRFNTNSDGVGIKALRGV